MKILKNFIKVDEVQFTSSGSEQSHYEDYIRPSEIIFMEVITKNSKNYTKIHFGIGSQKCDIFVSETPAEIDNRIEEFYNTRKEKKSVKSAKPAHVAGRNR